MSKKKAIGLFSVKAKEGGGDEASISTNHLILIVKPDQLRVGGFNVEPNSPLWGAQVDIKGEIKPGTYAFTELDAERSIVIGFYNPKEGGNSWNGQAQGGEITLLEVNHERKSARGSFKFIAVDNGKPLKIAEVRGDFSLEE